MLYIVPFQAPPSPFAISTISRRSIPVLSVPCQFPEISCAHRVLPVSVASATIHNIPCFIRHLLPQPLRMFLRRQMSSECSRFRRFGQEKFTGANLSNHRYVISFKMRCSLVNVCLAVLCLLPAARADTTFEFHSG